MSQPSRHEESRGAGRRRSDGFGDLPVTEPKLQAQNDRLLLRVGELIQRRFVAIQTLSSNRFLEGRPGVRVKVVVQGLVLRASFRAPGMIPDLVEEDLIPDRSSMIEYA